MADHDNVLRPGDPGYAERLRAEAADQEWMPLGWEGLPTDEPLDSVANIAGWLRRGFDALKLMGEKGRGEFWCDRARELLRNSHRAVEALRQPGRPERQIPPLPTSPNVLEDSLANMVRWLEQAAGLPPTRAEFEAALSTPLGCKDVAEFATWLGHEILAARVLTSENDGAYGAWQTLHDKAHRLASRLDDIAGAPPPVEPPATRAKLERNMTELRQWAEKKSSAASGGQGAIGMPPDSRLTLLDRYPATPDGHVEFVEFVRDDINYAAEAKRRQLERGYSNDTLASMVNGRDKLCAEARNRVATLSELPREVIGLVDSVLRRRLNVGTVEQFDELLRPAVRRLRDAFENADEPAAEAPNHNVANRLTWQDVTTRLETLRSQGEAFTSQQEFAERFGCSPATINKAVRNTASLKPWAKPPSTAAAHAQSLNAVVTDSVPQSRESDPADVVDDEDVDRVMRSVMEKAMPEERAKLNAMPPDRRAELARLVLNDPDKSDKILGRKA